MAPLLLLQGIVSPPSTDILWPVTASDAAAAMAPSLANVRASSAPTPRDAPVITTRRPASWPAGAVHSSAADDTTAAIDNNRWWSMTEVQL